MTRVKQKFPWFACLLVACSADDTPVSHGPNVKPDAGADTSALPDTFVPPDAISDQATQDVATDAPSCNATTVLLAGNASLLWGGSAMGGNAITVATVAGSAGDRIAIAPNGTGFVATLRSGSGCSGNSCPLIATVFNGSWADTAAIPNAMTIDAPALATLGSVSHVLYQDAAFKYEHRKYVASAWDSSDDPVGGAGSNQSFGAKAPSVAGAGADLVALQAGSDNLIYDQTWANASWAKAHQQANMAAENGIMPTIITLSGSDLLAVYMRKSDFKIMSTVRTGGTWDTNPTLLDANAFTNDAVAVASIGQGRALLVFRGSNDKVPYFSVYDPKKIPVWTTPSPVLAGKPTIASTPSVYAGVCGDEALVAYAKLSGGVELVHFAAGTFTGPVAVSGTAGATYAAVATKP